MEKLNKFYNTRADFSYWMTEEEWNEKEIEILKECLEPQINQIMKNLLHGVKCPLEISVKYDEENGVSVKINRQAKKTEDPTNSTEPQIHRSETVGFTVEFPDGTIVQRNKAKDTLIATLQVIGYPLAELI